MDLGGASEYDKFFLPLNAAQPGQSSWSLVLPRKPVRGRRAGQETESKILEAAEYVFARFGDEGARMDQVAERAQVEKANIYYYFAGKEELYNALIERIVEQVLTEVSGFLGSVEEGGPEEQLGRFLDLLFNTVQRYQGLIALAFGEFLHPPRKKRGRSIAWTMIEQIQSVGKELITQGIERGELRNQDPAQALLSIEGAIFYYFLLPEERHEHLTGRAKFDPQSLSERKHALQQHILKILQ